MFFNFFNKKFFRLLFFLIINLILIAFISFCLFFSYRFIQKKYIYPLEYKDWVFEYSKNFNLDSAIIFSIIKIESNFNAAAISNKNAMGLMQITSSTGNFIANNLNVKDYSLLNPKTNILFGCWYLKYLKNKFNNLNVVVAAYNAGEGNVANWLSNSNYSLDGKTLNAIPFSETKRYVDKFATTFAKYKKLYENILDKL